MISAWEKIRGTPPATAPKKKYIIGIGNRSIKYKSGLANTRIPAPPPRQNSARNKKFPFTSLKNELTEDISRS